MIKRLFKNDLSKDFLIYTFGSLFAKGVGFILIPLYTMVLTPHEYGTLEIINTFAALVVVFLSLGLPQVIFTEYYHIDKDKLHILYEDVIKIYFYVSVFIWIGICILFVKFNNLLFTEELSNVFTILIFGYIFISFFQSIYLSALKITGKSIEYSVVQIYVGIVSGILNIILVYFYEFGIIGILFTNFIVQLSVVSYVSFKYVDLDSFTFNIDFSTIKYYLKLSLPFVPGALAAWIMTASDRFILLKYLGEDAVGFYAVAYKFASIFEIFLITPLLLAYLPYIFKRFKEQNFSQYILVIMPSVLFISFLMSIILIFIGEKLVDSKFYNSLELISYLVFSFGFILLSKLLEHLFVYNRQTILLMNISLVFAVVNIVLNLVLIQQYGLKGVVYATLLTSIVRFLVVYILWFMTIKKIKVKNGI